MNDIIFLSNVLFPHKKLNKTFGSKISRPVRSLIPLIKSFNKLMGPTLRNTPNLSIDNIIKQNNLINYYYYLILSVVCIIRPIAPATKISISETTGLIFIKQKHSALFKEMFTLPLPEIVHSQYYEIIQFRSHLLKYADNHSMVIKNNHIEPPFLLIANKNKTTITLRPLYSMNFVGFINNNKHIDFTLLKNNQIRHIMINKIFGSVLYEYFQEMIQHNEFGHELWNRWSTASIKKYTDIKTRLDNFSNEMDLKSWKILKHYK